MRFLLQYFSKNYFLRKSSPKLSVHFWAPQACKGYISAFVTATFNHLRGGIESGSCHNGRNGKIRFLLQIFSKNYVLGKSSPKSSVNFWALQAYKG